MLLKQILLKIYLLDENKVIKPCDMCEKSDISGSLAEFQISVRNLRNDNQTIYQLCEHHYKMFQLNICQTFYP